MKKRMQILVNGIFKENPVQIRIPCYIVVVATFVTLVEMVVHAYLIDLYNALGIFLPLIVVN